jgi:hypothetical protein
MRLAAPLLALLLLYASIVAVTRGPEGERHAARPEVITTPTPDVARIAALGFRHVVADLYFLRAAQYFGNPANYRDHYRYLSPLLELVSELDPRFREPLLWGAVAIPKNLGRETWVNTAESTRLLEKGAQRFPNEWRFHVYLAYNRAFFHRDFIAAAKALERALGLPGVPTHIPKLITRLYATGGDLHSASELADAVASTAEDPDLKAAMEQRRLDIQTERHLRELDSAVQSFKGVHGRLPQRLEELVITGTLPVLPREPRGGRWLWNPTTQALLSSEMEGRLQVYLPPRVPIRRAPDSDPAPGPQEAP